MISKHKSNVVFRSGNFEITKREILASIFIIAILLLIGVLINEKITEYQMDLNEKYNKAVKIETQELFEYGMRTNIGNAFVYGELSAVDTVSYPEIDGEYMYIEKSEERYTMHTRQVNHTRTVNGKTKTYYTTEEYWTWDTVKTESLKCSHILFQGVVFPVDKIQIPNEKYITTVQENPKIRYQYYGTGNRFTGTIFTELKDGTISDHTKFYNDSNIENTLNHLENGYFVVVFWIAWAVFITICIFVFYYIDNRWLE